MTRRAGAIYDDDPWYLRALGGLFGCSHYAVVYHERVALMRVERCRMRGWHKLGSPGMGFHFRSNTEHVLFGVRGEITIPTHLRQPTLFAARKGAHSAKPDRFYEMVERVSPGPYLELFSRRRRYGWDVWGHEAPTEQASQAEMGLSA